MKANELMVGDWVFLKNGKVLETCQVTVIGNETQNRNDIGKYVCLDMSSEFPTCIFKIDEISPIPLTPEILEKNGFIKESRDCFGNPLQYCVLVDGLWIDISGENYFEGKLEHVHQLQHALRLCGIDKTIEL